MGIIDSRLVPHLRSERYYRSSALGAVRQSILEPLCLTEEVFRQSVSIQSEVGPQSEDT